MRVCSAKAILTHARGLNPRIPNSVQVRLHGEPPPINNLYAVGATTHGTHPQDSSLKLLSWWHGGLYRIPPFRPNNREDETREGPVLLVSVDQIHVQNRAGPMPGCTHGTPFGRTTLFVAPSSLNTYNAPPAHKTNAHDTKSVSFQTAKVFP